MHSDTPQSDTPQSDTPQSDTPQSNDHRNLADGAAAIAPVTDAMMDHAAHEAAALADGVARGTMVLERKVVDAGLAIEAATQAAVDRAAENAAEFRDLATDATRTLVEAATEAAEGAVRGVEAAAQDLNGAVDRGAEVARRAVSAPADALAQYNAKVLDVMQSNLASATALFTALIGAKSLPEALSLNADHLRRQVEVLTTQGRELATLAQRVALDALQPFKGAADR